MRMPDSPAVLPASRLAAALASCAASLLASLGYASLCRLGALALALFALLPSSRAQTLRVTTWNLQTPALARTNGAPANTNVIRIPDMARALKELNPDVILLQQVRDWKMCDQLAQALKPAKYNVVVCSAFLDPRTQAPRKQQVAILAKAKAYLAWSEVWRSEGAAALPGGFAFAALQVGKERVGVFSVQAGPVPGGGGAGKKKAAANQQARWTAALKQLVEQVGAVSDWVTNRVQVFAVGGTFATPVGQELATRDTALRLLEGAGFGDALLELPAAERVTVRGNNGQSGAIADYIFARPGGCTTKPRIQSVPNAIHYPATCDLALGLAAAVATEAERAEAAPPRQPQPGSNQVSQALAQPKPAETNFAPPIVQASQPVATAVALSPTPTPQWLWPAAAAAGTAVLAAMVWLLTRRRRVLVPPSPALLTAGADTPSGYTIVVGAHAATESASGTGSPEPLANSMIHVEAPGITQTHAEVLRQRALAAEERADRATALLRARLLPQLRQWLKQKLTRKLIADRTQLLQTQQAATLKTMAMEERLARIEQQLQRQNQAYQQRIEELTRELLVTKEESRELIRARIAQVKAEMQTARARMMAQAEADRGSNA